MKLSFHNSATVRAPLALVDRAGSWKPHNFPIRFGLLDHPAQGIVLIDTGYSDALFQSKDPHVALYRNVLRPKLNEAGLAKSVIEAIGAKSADVRHIILTHLHADHICGLDNFPNALIHSSAVSLAGWKNQKNFVSTFKGFFPSLLPDINARYVQPVETTTSNNLPWGGVGHDIFGDGSVISVDLPGHMKGHMGLVFPKLVEPTFHAADADWIRGSLDNKHTMPWSARLIVDNYSAVQKSKVIIDLARQRGFTITLCHDLSDA